MWPGPKSPAFSRGAFGQAFYHGSSHVEVTPRRPQRHRAGMRLCQFKVVASIDGCANLIAEQQAFMPFQDVGTSVAGLWAAALFFAYTAIEMGWSGKTIPPNYEVNTTTGHQYWCFNDGINIEERLPLIKICRELLHGKIKCGNGPVDVRSEKLAVDRTQESESESVEDLEYAAGAADILYLKSMIAKDIQHPGLVLDGEGCHNPETRR
ncbi:hypothetical protein G7046_g4540 [Stylonectria norvegica]|nr:hypothetical protein G7046_g4540 [Stylonectria norvegica]